ncbi:uncharacterized protein LOC141688932 [Apium graveolens]|uniref:uncharacterized protein LOC141688932 n=1 Tax=Apium graveolens TaxID=4045 RepID=UPI003D7AFA95
MSRDLILRSPPLDRRQPLLSTTSIPSHRNTSRCLAETAGMTTAGCAAVCCLPVGVVAILFLAVYKVPAKLCRRAIRMKKRRRLRSMSSPELNRNRCECGFEEVHMMSCGGGQVVCGTSLEMDNDVMELEKEMWDRFYGTGFWRSLSQREG